MIELHPPREQGAGLCADDLASAVWIDLIDPTPEEAALVAAATGLSIPSREALSEVESSSRLQVRDDVLRLSAPLLAHADTPEQTLTPVGFVLSPNRLVTVRFARLRVFDSVMADAGADRASTGQQVFGMLLEAIVDRSADLLEHLAGELEALSRSVFRTRRHTDRSPDDMAITLCQVGQIGDRLSEIRASLLGVSRIVPFTVEVASAWLSPGLKMHLSAVRQDIVSLADFEQHLENKTQFLLDAVLGFISTRQNDLFKILTIVSVVGVPPTLLASLWGMNFEFMPELHWRLGYPFAVITIIVSALVPMAWFKWKRWW